MRLPIHLLLLCPALALAQTGTWSSPRLGYFYDPDVKAIRILSGVPGAAGAEETLAYASKLESAWISPARSYALATVHDTGELQLVTFTRGGTEGSALDQAIQPTLVAFSPSGSAAVLWNQDMAKLQVWSGLPNAPALARQTAAHAITAAAVTDDGSLLAVVDEAEAAISSRDKDLQHLPLATAVQFLRDSTSLLVAFASTNQVSLIRNPGPQAEVGALAGTSEGISGPIALALAGSSRQVAVANAVGRSVTVIDLDTRANTTLACDCSPRQIAPLAGGSVFRVSGDAMLVLDRPDGAWRLTSVPFNGGIR